MEFVDEWGRQDDRYSRSLALGVPRPIVRDIVGHSDIKVTTTLYVHAALDEQRAALG
ncbi:hypothetical protein ABZ914_10735 [Spirillospora sp. NPDC046719]